MKNKLEMELDITLSEESKRTLKTIEDMNEKMMALTAAIERMEHMKNDQFIRDYFSRKV